MTEWMNTLYQSDNLWLESASILTLFFMAVLLLNTLIHWGPQLWAKKTQNIHALFAFNALKLPLNLTLLLLAISQILALFNLPQTVTSLIPSIFSSIDIIIWGQFIYRTSQFSLKNLSRQAKTGSIIQPQTLPLLENASAVIIILLIIYLLFITWNIDMTAWLASAGIIGIAIGFAAKDTIANLLSGVFILADSPYKIHDYIVLDSGERGMVTHIGLRSTRILTRDDLEINIPNAIIANGKIVNESSGRHVKSRTRIKVGVAYGSDIDFVKGLLLDEAAHETQICQDPEPRVRFRTFGPSSLDLELLVWIDNPEIRGRVIDSLNTKIYKRFALEKVEIPYSKHDLYIKSFPKLSVEQDTL
jgi:MscS family membrane protein